MGKPHLTRKLPDPTALATQGRQTSQIRPQSSSDKPRIWKVVRD